MMLIVRLHSQPRWPCLSLPGSSRQSVRNDSGDTRICEFQSTLEQEVDAAIQHSPLFVSRRCVAIIGGATAVPAAYEAAPAPTSYLQRLIRLNSRTQLPNAVTATA